ncbi:hypothetical protein D9M71_404580 [compost metagenome]
MSPRLPFRLVFWSFNCLAIELKRADRAWAPVSTDWRDVSSVAEVETPCIEVKNFCSTPVSPVLVSESVASSGVA